ncbi:efflux RND transporter permease subunit [Inquilinus limosus]|uniref:ABC transporter permease n=1 Tax=Inquilinus limosus TaxID=171674 RepID=A0A211ZUC1_9PROT|nr:efflux RND transporter permease subunit [Inquilinus limosus]OWJ68898.1 ABC transporter permease [Inquilinus limosus]
MTSGLSSWSIRRPIPVLVLFAVLTLAGWWSFLRLPVNANPKIEFPIVTVTVTQAGAAPSELESQVTRRIEGAVAGLAGARHITSTIADGTSSTTVEFRIGVDPDRAATDVRDAVTNIRSDLPQGIEEPIVARLDVEGGAILYYGVRAPQMSAVDLSWFVDDRIARDLLAVTGVQKVQRLGGVGREIRVELDPDRLAALGITADQVNAQLRSTNADVPGGRGEIGAREQAIRTLGGARTVSALADTPIALPNGRWARLATLGTVTDGAGEQRSLARLDGEPVVAFAVYRAKGASDTVVADGVAARLAELQSRTPGVTIGEIASTVEYTRDSYDSGMATLVEGALLTVLVVFLFLHDWRATLIAAVAMPLSILPAFWAMDLLGFTLNSISLLALTLVIGILVDDAIVEIENIDRHLHLGKRPYRAAIDAADAIGLAVVATTLTIVAVFAPVSFIGGVTGQYFEQFGLTVAVAVLASLLVARLLTPLMAAYLLQPKRAATGGDAVATPPGGRYVRLLNWTLDHRGATLAAAGALLAGSLLLVPLLPSGFLPDSDSRISNLTVELPPGATLADTDAVAGRIAAELRQRPEVDHVFATIGEAGGAAAADANASSGDIAKASLVIVLKPRSERQVTRKAFERSARDELSRIPDIRFAFLGESGGKDVSIVLTGDDPDALSAAARALEREMRGLPVLANARSTEPLPRPEIRIRPRPDEAARLGVSAQAIGIVARIATIGDTDANSAKFNLGDRQVPIRVALDRAARADIETLRQLRVAGDRGAVPLTSVAEIGFGAGDAEVERFDRRRRVSVDADLNGVPLGTALAAIEALPALAQLPEGVERPAYGDAESMDKMFASFGGAMMAGLLVVLAVLVLLFRDFLQPVTILAALPLSAIGAVLALLGTGAALDLSTVIGLLMLMGIVTKNSILLVDFAIEGRRAGLDRRTALIQACLVRARPIVMTTLAMIAGMMPAALGFGTDAGFRGPMAAAVIGGLVTSTALSLVLVPAVFTLMDDLRAWLAPRLGRLTSVTEADRMAAEPAAAARQEAGHA